jgi:hypothetical protein
MQKSEIQAQYAKTHYRQKSENWPKLTVLRAYFFFFSFLPSQTWKQQQGMKKTSPARACAPLLTKPPPKKNPGKRNKWV